jgi:hypothetical protein
MARFVEVARNRGVDSWQPGKEWMMVPQGGSNLVCLEDGDGYTVREKKGKDKLTFTKLSPSQAHGAVGSEYGRLKAGSQIYQVNGKPKVDRETWIEATNGKDLASIHAVIHDRLDFKVAFYFLQDKGAKDPRSKYGPKDVDGWIERLNNIYGLQANMWFAKASADPLPLEGLSETFGSEGDIKKIQEKMAGGEVISVFLAGEKIVTLEKDYPLGFFDLKTKVIVVKDQAESKNTLKTIAHEIGHHRYDKRNLTGDPHEGYKKNGYEHDLFHTMDGDDVKIPMQRVQDMNPV